MDTIDTGQDTIAARNYAAAQNKLLRLLDANVDDVPVPADITPAATQDPITASIFSDTIESKNTDLVALLGLKAAKETVEITLPFTTNKGTSANFTVILRPIALTVTDDCITILIDSSVNIKPPTLTPLIIKKEGILYNVVYAGTMLQTPKLNLLSFLRTSN